MLVCVRRILFILKIVIEPVKTLISSPKSVANYEPVHETNNLVPTRSDIHRAVQSQKKVGSWKFRVSEEGLYYPCGENKGAD